MGVGWIGLGWGESRWAREKLKRCNHDNTAVKMQSAKHSVSIHYKFGLYFGEVF